MEGAISQLVDNILEHPALVITAFVIIVILAAITQIYFT